MIDELKEGHWYRWVGSRTRPPGWNFEGYMDFILDGKPHKCIYSDSKLPLLAAFEDQPILSEDEARYFRSEIEAGRRTWLWHGGDYYFEEVNQMDKNGNLLFDF